MTLQQLQRFIWNSFSVAFSPQANYTDQRPPRPAELVTNLRVKGVTWSVQRIPPTFNIGFIDRNLYFYFK
jgi:hypothetical protein